MNKKQLTSLTIKGFKVFEDFHINGMKRVNLIGGKNNLGKTSFLEALEMLLKAKTAFGLRMVSTDIIRRRQTKKSMSFPQQQMPIQEIEFDFFANRKNRITISDNNHASVQIRYVDVGEAIESDTIMTFNESLIKSIEAKGNFVSIPFLEFIGVNQDGLALPVQDMIKTIIQDSSHVEHNVHYISSCTTDETALAGL